MYKLFQILSEPYKKYAFVFLWSLFIHASQAARESA